MCACGRGTIGGATMAETATKKDWSTGSCKTTGQSVGRRCQDARSKSPRTAQIAASCGRLHRCDHPCLCLCPYRPPPTAIGGRVGGRGAARGGGTGSRRRRRRGANSSEGGVGGDLGVVGEVKLLEPRVLCAEMNDGRTSELEMMSAVLANRGLRPRRRLSTSWGSETAWPTSRRASAICFIRWV